MHNQTPTFVTPWLLEVFAQCGDALETGVLILAEDLDYQVRRSPIRDPRDPEKLAQAFCQSSPFQNATVVHCTRATKRRHRFITPPAWCIGVCETPRYRTRPAGCGGTVRRCPRFAASQLGPWHGRSFPVPDTAHICDARNGRSTPYRGPSGCAAMARPALPSRAARDRSADSAATSAFLRSYSFTKATFE
jgi:hypothetical protein